MTLNLDGLIPATVLPMDADGRIDEPALRSYIAWVVAQGPVALAINVDTGEGPHLTHDEKVRVLQVVREVTDLPIVAGLAGPSTEAAVRQAKDFKAAGANALLVFPIPAYLSTPLNPRVPVAYHEAVASVGLPLVLFQLQPALGGLNFEPDTLRALASIDGVVAMKEASFDARRFVDVARLLEDLPRPITLLTGNDNFILESFMLGATGALIGFGAVMTREQVDMIDAWKAGRIDEARALGRRVQRLADVVFAAPVGDYRVRLKECLRILGVLERTDVRLPLQPIRDEERALPRPGPGRGRAAAGPRAVDAARARDVHQRLTLEGEPPMAVEPADVLIIGAGASGAVVALRLAQAGFKVTCLEQGEWMDRDDYPGNKLDWELKARKDWATSPNVRGLVHDYPIVEDDTPVSPLMYNAVGGSTIIFAGAWPRALPSDFRVRSLDGIADDWPIDYFELLPYFYRTDRRLRRVGAARRPRLSAATPRTRRCRRCRSGRPGSRSRGRTRSSAGTGGPSSTRSTRSRTTAGGRASSAAPASRAATRAPRRRPTSPTGRRRSPSARS